MLKIAALLALAGLLGVVVAVVLGEVAAADYVLSAAFVSFALAGVIFMVHVIVGLW